MFKRLEKIERNNELLKSDIKRLQSDNDSLKRKFYAREFYLNHIEIHLNEHCNLNCAYCDHYVPLAEEAYTNLQSFENDLNRLGVLTGNYIESIKLLGGEPLLNKNINEYLKIARKYFPKTDICLYTNGILLPKMADDFWNECEKQKIKILISVYPIHLDRNKIEEKFAEYHISFEYPKFAQHMYKIPVNLKGDGNAAYNFINCGRSACAFLRDGKIYMCPTIACIQHFNKFFNKNIPVEEDDYIDIYKAQNVDEILQYLSKPVPFCKWCNIDGVTHNHKWKVSEKKIEEWT